MNYQTQYRAYNAAAQTMAKTRQIILLYEGMIRFAQQWRGGIEQKETEPRFNAFRRLNDIVDALHNCLDFEEGGDIAPMLSAFYHNLSMDLAQAERLQDLALADDVIARLRRMRDNWEEIDKKHTTADSLPSTSAPDSNSGGFEYTA